MKKFVAITIAVLAMGAGFTGCTTKKYYYPPQAYVVDRAPIIERERVIERPPVIEREYVAPR